MNFQRSWRIAFSLGTLSVFMASMPPAQAQAPAPSPAAQMPTDKTVPQPLDLPPLPRKRIPSQRFGDWAKTCNVQQGEQVKQCHLIQAFSRPHNNQRRTLLVIRMGNYGNPSTPTVVFRVPLALALYLPTGITFNVPGVDPLKLPFVYCLPKLGCQAEAKLPATLVAAMQNASKGSVEVVTLRKQKIKIPVSFTGITAGFASLHKG
jgi:invasion protein IalB